MAGRAGHGPLAQIVRPLGGREQSVREPDSGAGGAGRGLRGPAGPRTLGLGGQSLRAEALDERRLWQHVLDVLALSLWTEQLAQTRSRSEQVTALLLAARDRVDREEKWLKARTGEPIATVRARLAEIAVARSFAR